MRAGFIGLGTMGRPMALNLIRAGHELAVCDVDAAALEPALAAGATRSASPREAASGREVVVTMLPASRHVEAVMFGDDGVVAGVEPGTTVIDMSTIDPGTTRRVAAAIESKGGFMLDAPVSGSSTGAEQGTLTIMVGGPADVLERHRGLLEAMGSNVIHCGATGMGEAVKLCNNLVAGATVAALAEAFALARRLGCDAHVLFDVMSKSSGNCWALQTRPPVAGLVESAPAERDFAPGFMVDLMHKDLGLVMAAGSELRLPLAMAAAAQQLYALASQEGLGGRDFSAVFKVLEQDAEVKR
jgi:3-hydroxyisobutyrate dehydrogenase